MSAAKLVAQYDEIVSTYAAITESEEYEANPFDFSKEYEHYEDALMALVHELAEELRPPQWALLVGGVVQDSSENVEYADLDWLEEPQHSDVEEMARSWSLLHHAVSVGHVGWIDDLARVRDILCLTYNEQDTPEEERVWYTPITEPTA